MNLAIRPATPSDIRAVLHLFDDAIEWFTSIGNDGQWGTERWSTQDKQIARITDACSQSGAWVAEGAELGLCGFLVLGDAMPYVEPPSEPEIYVRVLVGSRDQRVKGVGRRLLAFADEQARAAGVGRLRVDCYAGGSGALVSFYESCGYERISTFMDEDWPGQLLGRSL
ncbi:GNAT family N-acetyltransferase [Rhodococcus qingshengii]|uniref:GNAT family N-acetyltransferase n=1 Tax=Rhodococcus qingshengii TaxID=334542 RepID=UPI0036DCF1FB